MIHINEPGGNFRQLNPAHVVWARSHDQGVELKLVTGEKVLVDVEGCGDWLSWVEMYLR